MEAPRCSNPQCPSVSGGDRRKASRTQVLERPEAWTFLCPTCHGIETRTKPAFKRLVNRELIKEGKLPKSAAI